MKGKGWSVFPLFVNYQTLLLGKNETIQSSFTGKHTNIVFLTY